MTQHDTSTSTGALVSQLSEEISTLIRDELRLGQTELAAKAKRGGTGLGLFGAAGILALFGLGVLIATAILALALVIDAWLAALIVGVALLVIAGVTALVGRRQVSEATPPLPTQTIDSVKEDVNVLKKRGKHS